MKSITEFLKINENIIAEFEAEEKPVMNINGVDREIDWFSGETLETSEYVSFKIGNSGYQHTTPYGVQQETLRRLDRSGLGKLLKAYTFENFSIERQYQKIMKDAALKFIEETDKWFVALGQPGSGKSHICTAISAEMMKRGRSFEYLIWIDKVNQIKYDRPEYQSILHRYKTVDVLYIDDFLKTQRGQKPSRAEVELAFEILNARYNSKKTTIISSEKTIDELREYDQAMCDRMYQLAGDRKEYLLRIGNDDRKNMRVQGSVLTNGN